MTVMPCNIRSSIFERTKNWFWTENQKNNWMETNTYRFDSTWFWHHIDPILCNDFPCRSKATEKPILAVTDPKNQVNLAQSHTNYQMSMMPENLIGVIALDETFDIIYPVTKTVSSMLSLRDILLYYLKMSDGHSMIAKTHQEECSNLPQL